MKFFRLQRQEVEFQSTIKILFLKSKTQERKGRSKVKALQQKKRTNEV
jgi:hypothetical protein